MAFLVDNMQRRESSDTVPRTFEEMSALLAQRNGTDITEFEQAVSSFEIQEPENADIVEE